MLLLLPLLLLLRLWVLRLGLLPLLLLPLLAVSLALDVADVALPHVAEAVDVQLSAQAVEEVVGLRSRVAHRRGVRLGLAERSRRAWEVRLP